MPKKKTLFIINKLSGTVAKYDVESYIEKYLDEENFEYEYLIIDKNLKKSHYKSTLQKDWDVVVPVGGDGTLLRLGHRLTGRDLVLGIIPLGSGNGFATHIGYKPRDIKNSIDIINKYNIRQVDVAEFGAKKKYFYSNLGYGLDATVAKDFQNLENRSLWAYTRLVLKRVFKLKVNKVTYSIGDKKNKVKTYLFNVFNSNLYGYNIGPVPTANVFDGMLDVFYMKAVAFWRLPWASFCMLIKKPTWSDALVHFKTENITIHVKKKILFQIDGEPKKTKSNIDIKVLPTELKFIVGL